MSAIKKFFEKKKLDSKFKQAGSGHRLTDASQPRHSGAQQKPVSRPVQSSSDSKAGEAALLRLQQKQSQASKPKSSTATWKHASGAGGTAINYDQMKNEFISVSRPMCPSTNEPTVSTVVTSLAVDAILFTCPICPTSLPKPDIYGHVKECLDQELDAEPLMISITMLHTLNPDKAKVESCVHILGKYLQNIIDYPEEEKYRKIRKENKAFAEKVLALIGAWEFLIKGCGFELKTLPFEEKDGSTTEQEFFVLSEELSVSTEQLTVTKQMLTDAEPLQLCLDRNMKVLEPSSYANRMEVPASFYTITSTEVKHEHMEKAKEIDKMSELRTKVMRENEATKKRKTYKFLVLRIRFPDGHLLQGTFRCSEKLEAVKEFVTEHLHHDWLPFSLCDSIGRPLAAECGSLSTLNLAPASILTFVIDETIKNEIASSSSGKIQYLKDECLALLQSLNI